jgi:hypothetical protein
LTRSLLNEYSAISHTSTCCLESQAAAYKSREGG